MNVILRGAFFIITTTIPVFAHFIMKYKYLKQKFSPQQIFLVFFLVNFWTFFTYAMLGDCLEEPKIIPHFISVPSDIFFYVLRESFFSLLLFPFTLIPIEEDDKEQQNDEDSNEKQCCLSKYEELIKIFFLIYFCFFLHNSTYFIEHHFSEASADQVKFVFAVNSKSDYTTQYVIRFANGCILIPFGLTILVILLYKNVFPVNVLIWIHPKQIVFRFHVKVFILIHLFALLLHFCYQVGIWQYLDFFDNHFYENNVVDPKTIKITMPEKRNLIIGILESMESSFTAPEYGGLYGKNTIPEMTKLALNPNFTHFTHNNFVGGHIQTSGAQWSFGGVMAFLSGLSLKMSLQYTNFYPFLPHVKMFSDVLKENGYKQYLLLGHTKEWMNTNSMYDTHGFTTLGTNEIFDIMGIDKEHRPHFYDYDLYNFTKTFTTNVSKSGDPFTVMFATMDTHMPRGILCKLCRNESSLQEETVNYCADRQLSDFVDWFLEQPFAHNTTLVFLGDHASMIYYFTTIQKKSLHHIYNLIINPAKTTNYTKNRKFHAFDLAPTILTALGANIEGNRFWLGTDLFSGEKTLGEKYGLDKVNNYINQHSEWFNHEILKVDLGLQLKIDNATWYEDQQPLNDK